MFTNVARPSLCWGFDRRAVTATTTVAATDRGYTIDCTSGTYDVAVTAAATLGSGFPFAVYNSGSGTVTVNPNGAETLRTPSGTVATIALTQGQGLFVLCDGSNFEVVGAVGLYGGSTISGLTANRVVTAFDATTVQTPASVTTSQAWAFSSTLTVVDGNFTITGSSDATKTIKFEADAQTAGADLTIDAGAQTVDRTLSVPVLSGNTTLAVIGQAQTFTGIQTFGTPIASTSGGTGVNNAGTITNASNTTITGGGTLALGGFTLTAPATGTAMLLGTTQTATGDKTFSSGTVTVSSAALSTAQVVVAATAGQVAQFNIRGNGLTNGLVAQSDGSSDATIANFANRPLYFGTNASSNMVISASPGDVSVLTTTDSTSLATGAFKVAGGASVSKRLCLDGDTGKTLKIINGVAPAAVAVTLGLGPTGSTAGTPQGWMRIDIAGTDRYIPYW